MHAAFAVLAVAVVAVCGSLAARRTGLPAPSVLVVLGLVVGVAAVGLSVRPSPDLLAYGVLPPLLYAGSAGLSVPDLRDLAVPVTVLCTVLVVATAAVLAAVVHGVAPEVPVSAAFVVGAALSSTDPVAVGALSRRLTLPRRLLTLVQAESLFNDATSLVLFEVAITTVGVHGLSGGHVATTFVRLAGGGILCGLLLSAPAAVLVGRFRSRPLAVALSLAVPYAAYVLADELSASGVTAVIVTGLVLGRRITAVAAEDPLQGRAFGLITEGLEAAVFAVVGLALPGLIRALPAGERSWFPLALCVFAVVLVARVGVLLPVSGVRVLLRRRWFGPLEPRSWRRALVLAWAGTRGAVPLVAILAIPDVAAGHPFPHRDLLLVVADFCIAGTLLLQGFTLGPLVRRLGVADD